MCLQCIHSYRIYLLPFLVFRRKGIQIQDLILLIGKRTKFFSFFVRSSFIIYNLAHFLYKYQVFYNTKLWISHHQDNKFKNKREKRLNVFNINRLFIVKTFCIFNNKISIPYIQCRRENNVFTNHWWDMVWRENQEWINKRPKRKVRHVFPDTFICFLLLHFFDILHRV